MSNKSVTELRDEIRQLDARAKVIMDGFEAEGRTANSAELKELGEIQSKRYRLNVEIDEAEALARRAGTTKRSKESFSLAKAILNAASRSTQRDAEMEVFARAAELHAGSGCNSLSGHFALPMEERGVFTAATESAKGVVIDENKQEMLFPLQPYLTFSKLGVRMLTGLKGDIVWPAFSDVAVNWEGENAALKDAGGAFSKGKKFSPVRIGAEAQISKQLLMQENIDVEAILRRQIAMAIAQKLEATAFSASALSDSAPAGLFTGAELTANGAMSWENIVELETKLATNNALVGSLGYAMHPALRGKAKTKVKDTSGAGGFVFDALGTGDGFMNGYKTVTSTNIPANLGDGGDQYGVIFGNWADYFLGQWGALDFIVDPYTAGNQSIVKLYITGYYNMGAIRPESFAFGALK